ncbi:unnamed protein product [Trichobilharzia regenti]|nr:unnamed protein product [Trichobilharzia regenti]
MAVESGLRKATKIPYSVVTRASAREGKSPGIPTPSRTPILKTRVDFVCPDTTPALLQSSTETTQAIPEGQDSTPASTVGQCVKHSKPKRKRSRRHKTSKASSRKEDECQACSTTVSKTDLAFNAIFANDGCTAVVTKRYRKHTMSL